MMTREQVVTEARTWIGTPFHQNQMLKGVGVDCGRLLYAIYRAAGIIPADDAPEPDDPSGPITGRYAHDWFANTTNERYLRRAMRYGWKIAESVCIRTMNPLPGNLVLTRCVGSENYNHGGIVVAWPHVIHCCDPEVEQVCAMDHKLWAYKKTVILDPWEKVKQQ
jgi:cell wall-associated NlpC family hydrolase